MYFNTNGAGNSIFKYLGTGNTFDIKALYPNNYKEFTVDNFIISAVSASTSAQSVDTVNSNAVSYAQSHTVNASQTVTLTKNYNAVTGILTIGNVTGSGAGGFTSSEKDPSGKNIHTINLTTTVTVNCAAYLVAI